MIILGLTGGIAMGKTTVADFFRARGIPVHNADEAVHRLYNGEGAAALAAHFPSAIENSRVNRTRLKLLLKTPQDWEKLEAAIHPLVHKDRDSFMSEARQKGARLVLLDIPLLYETGLDRQCDAVIVVSAPLEQQKARALQRPGITPEKFEQILLRQMPDAKKRTRAHYTISTGGTLAATARQVDAIIRLYAGR